MNKILSELKLLGVFCVYLICYMWFAFVWIYIAGLIFPIIQSSIDINSWYGSLWLLILFISYLFVLFMVAWHMFITNRPRKY